ncbi:hypothetical protein P153DRAFT_180941 [Dothidotthia symphoricarpi CBS 119687]|uniref:Uncharacterized protein n=1 Tax=Dothidotthia symphoricarpi CBS 119687 TaxID=1392245 RepID=A0A6A6ALB8_9PLEO|nr:uncharacterized protein P153DRAFT_180941 [Dothidotthia symphoricarpi CBS 119687]KAF2131908.1 hypothetical protein P153DRAFT_180941 [Dothidotthia symphoricarpi CBS 119687]
MRILRARPTYEKEFKATQEELNATQAELRKLQAQPTFRKELNDAHNQLRSLQARPTYKKELEAAQAELNATQAELRNIQTQPTYEKELKEAQDELRILQARPTYEKEFKTTQAELRILKAQLTYEKEIREAQDELRSLQAQPTYERELQVSQTTLRASREELRLANQAYTTSQQRCNTLEQRMEGMVDRERLDSVMREAEEVFWLMRKERLVADARIQALKRSSWALFEAIESNGVLNQQVISGPVAELAQCRSDFAGLQDAWNAVVSRFETWCNQ